MNKTIILIALCLFFSCKNNVDYYDVDGPVLNFYSFGENNILFQFDEPILKVKYSIISNSCDKSLSIMNIFPVANIYFDSMFLENQKDKILQIEVTDTSNNLSLINIPCPAVNKNPAIIEIEEVKVNSSKNKFQRIVLISKKVGSTIGFCLVLFIKNNKIEIPFKQENIFAGQKLIIEINSEKEILENKYEIGFSDVKKKLLFRNKLSQTFSLIYILDNYNNIKDYLLYYNSKKHALDYYLSKKQFKSLQGEFFTRGINPVIYDIAIPYKSKNKKSH